MTENPAQTLDAIKTEQMISLLQKLRGKQWLGPPQTSYGLDNPSLLFTMVTNKDQTIHIKIGTRTPEGGFAAQLDDQPLIFEISEEDYKILNEDIILAAQASLVPPATPRPLREGDAECKMRGH